MEGTRGACDQGAKREQGGSSGPQMISWQILQQLFVWAYIEGQKEPYPFKPCHQTVNN